MLIKSVLVGAVCFLGWVSICGCSTKRKPALDAGQGVRLCPVLLEKSKPQRQLLRAAKAEQEKKFGPDTEPDVTLRALEFCVETRAGAWALSLDSLRREEQDAGVTGRWSIVHAARDGSRAVIAPALPSEQSGELADKDDNFVDQVGNAHLSIELPQLYDYDHDGEPELIVQIVGHIHEGGDWRRGRVWTFKNGAVMLYPPAAQINVREVKDVDDDGLLDLLTVGPFAATAEAPGAPYELVGPRLVAHARADGRFALDDDVARAAALKVCPALPMLLVAKQKRPDGAEEIAMRDVGVRVACARLWGRASAALTVQLTRECPPSDDPNLSCDMDTLSKFAAVAALPIELQKTAVKAK